MPPPSWSPQRIPPGNHHPGNPLYSQAQLQHPLQNVGGLLPGPANTTAPLAWSKLDFANFASDGTNQVWTFDTPIFDLRPGVSQAYGQIPAATPINHEGALGQAVYLVAIVGESSGTTPPASTTGIICEYFEDGSGVQAQNGLMNRLTQDIDITETLLAGGISTVVPFGASPLSFTPCVSALRFWRLTIRLTIGGVAPITLPYYIQASLH